MATASNNQYRKEGSCVHQSRGDADAERGTGFAVWPGAEPPSDDPPRIPFQGDVYQEITWQGTDQDGHRSAVLQIVKFQMTGEHPDLGRLEISLDTSRPGVIAYIRAMEPGQMFPIIHTTRLHVIATASAVPGILLQDQGPPLEFVSEPSDSWPPINNIYRLGVPVRFEDRGTPGPVVVTASEGTVEVSSTRA